MRWLFACAISAIAAAPLAQYDVDDESLKEAEERDRRYLEQQKRGRDEAIDPQATPEQLRAAFLELADSLIRDLNFDAAESEHFIVRTDDPRLEPDLVVALFEEFVDFFEAYWTPSGELAPAGEKTPVFMFYSFAEYDQLLGGRFRLSPNRPKGHYTPALDVIAAHSDADSVGDLTDTMLHELTHQLVNERLQIGHVNAPPWIVEGIATYFGFTYRDENDGFVPGRIGHKHASFYRQLGPQKPREPLSRLQSLKRELRLAERNGTDLIRDLLELEDAGSFYAEASTAYPASWAAFHYLLHGAEGRHRDAFVRFLRGEELHFEALLAALEVEAEALTTAIAEHVRAMRVR